MFEAREGKGGRRKIKNRVKDEEDEKFAKYFYFFPTISQCSAIKYLSINFHNNMCMNKTFWFGKYVCTCRRRAHNVPSRHLASVPL
jgi:hypothetical protein